MPRNSSASHRLVRPARQYPHLPHASWNGTATRSPTPIVLTSLPTAVTVPANSWPIVTGSAGASPIHVQSPIHTCQSVRQIPSNSTSTTASPGPGSGSATSSMTSGAPISTSRAAFMSRSHPPASPGPPLRATPYPRCRDRTVYARVRPACTARHSDPLTESVTSYARYSCVSRPRSAAGGPIVVLCTVGARARETTTRSVVRGLDQLAGELGRPREHHLVAPAHLDQLELPEPRRHPRVPRAGRQRQVVGHRDVAAGKLAAVELTER